MAKKKALIIGITGQDGSYLAEFLLKKNYKVHGMVRRSSMPNTQRIDHILSTSRDDESSNKRIVREYGDLSSSENIQNIIKRIKPDEIYNLGAQSHVKVSFEIPEYTYDIVAVGPLRVLEAIKNIKPNIKYLQASSSEMFGNSRMNIQSLNRNRPMLLQKLWVIGQLRIIEIILRYSLQMSLCLIMSLPEED